jgi:ubiquinone/menaquinone biosynthesis C-methylase UbiE
MSKEIDKNKIAWSLLSEEHYNTFKARLEKEDTLISDVILKELGDINGKTLMHLQCNIGQDTISLARAGLKKAVGVDLSDQNIIYAEKLRKDFGMDNLSYIEANVLELDKIHQEKYDIVFTSEGVLGWLPDLKKWAKVIKHVLKEDGFFYVYDSHPVFHVFDEVLIGTEGKLEAKYDYFNAEADFGMEIGGYAAKTKTAENYWWNHSLSDIVNALIEAGLKIEYLHEFDTLFWDNGNMVKVEKGQYIYPKFKKKLPFAYSLKAVHQ